MYFQKEMSIKQNPYCFDNYFYLAYSMKNDRPIMEAIEKSPGNYRLYLSAGDFYTTERTYQNGQHP